MKNICSKLFTFKSWVLWIKLRKPWSTEEVFRTQRQGTKERRRQLLRWRRVTAYTPNLAANGEKGDTAPLGTTVGFFGKDDGISGEQRGDQEVRSHVVGTVWVVFPALPSTPEEQHPRVYLRLLFPPKSVCVRLRTIPFPDGRVGRRGAPGCPHTVTSRANHCLHVKS